MFAMSVSSHPIGNEKVPLNGAERVFLHPPHGTVRVAAETLVRNVYQATYGARVPEFLPLLLELHGASSGLAVLGMRLAQPHENLYLEHYLESPIEQEIAVRMGRPVARGDIVEIGNLAASSAGLSAPLFLVMAAALSAAQYRWLAFTATPQVERIVARLNYAPLLLCDVDVERLGERAQQWGRYYESRPRVMCCDLVSALRAASSLSWVSNLLKTYAGASEKVAQQLQFFREMS